MDEGAAVGIGVLRLIEGRFEVTGTLGKGGMGVVYSALDRELGVEVALKTLRGLTPENLLQFKSEFRLLSDVRHPNLVRLGELFESEGTWFFTMDRLAGVSLLEWIHRDGPLPDHVQTSSTALAPDAATSIERPSRAAAPRKPPEVHVCAPEPLCDVDRLRVAMRGLARGLAALHANGVVHRDVKPSNVLVDETGRAVLLDFGAVAELHHAHREATVIGTVAFMAPEQARGDTVGPAADWYAVGVLLFHALTGQVPFKGATHHDTLILKQTLAAPSPSTLAAGIPADLEWLCVNLLHTEPEARPSEAKILEILDAAGDAESTTAAPTFVGRTKEIAALDAALASSREQLACFLIEGESGIGKSALVASFLRRAAAAQPRLVVLRGRCHERERVAFNAIDGVIDELARFLAGRRETSLDRLVPAHASELLAVFPALRAVPVFAERATDAPPSTADLRGRAFAALAELLALVGARRPVVIAIDDIQWADTDSVAVLEELLRAGPPILVVATRRTREGQGVAQRLVATGTGVRAVELWGLDQADAAQLVRFVARDPDAETAQVVVESRGHPMFLTELVRHRHESSKVTRLEDVIWGRVQKLDEPARRLLVAVAVAGSPVPRSIAYAVAGLDGLAGEQHTGVLAAARLVRVHGPRPQDAIEPFHDRVRVAVTAHVSADEQRRLHGALAQHLEALGASVEALLSRFEAAGDVKRSANYLVAAAKAALDAYAFGRAVELYRRALEGTTVPDRRAALLIHLGDALANDGRTAEAADCYFEAAGLETADGDRQLDLLRRAAERYLMAGRLEHGLATARAVLARVDMTLPSSRARTIAGILWNQMRMRRGTLDYKPRTAPVPLSLRADICWSLGAGLGMVDTLLGAYFSGHAARLALAHGTTLQIARAVSAATVGAAVMGRRERAELLLATARRAAADDGTPVAQWYADLARTTKEFVLDNEFARAAESASRLEREWYAAGRGPGWETDVAMHFHLSSMQMSGRFAEMAARVAVLVAAARRKGDLFQDVTLRVRFAARHLLGGNHAEARADVHDALASWLPDSGAFGNQRGWGLWSRIRIELYAGQLATLEEQLGAECKRMQSSLVGRIPIMRVEWYQTYGTYLLGAAIAARARGDASAAAAHVRRANSVATKCIALPFKGAPTSGMTLRAAIACVGEDREARVQALRAAIDESYAREIHVYTPFVERRLGEELGGDEGAALIARGDARARAAGFTNPERAAEICAPSGRFA